MKYQPIPRLGLSVYPERERISEQTIAPFIKSLILPFCLTVCHGIYKLLKALSTWWE